MRRAAIAFMLLVIGAGVAIAGGDEGGKKTPDFRSFRPSVHGFGFVNHFEGSPLPVSLGGLEHRAGAPNVFGLCGGMSFAAADYFVAGKTVPLRKTPPVRGEAMYAYISKRQTESFGEGMGLAAKFGRWMGEVDDGWMGTRMLSARELEEIVPRLERGEPVVLGLVLDRHAGNTAGRGPVGKPWENHQVLAYGVSEGAGGAIELRVYDPNYPGNDGVVIRCKPVITDVVMAGAWGGVMAPVMGAVCERVAPGRRTTLVRGVFAMEYAPVTPPEGLE